jgi:uncharacterized membrane protein
MIFASADSYVPQCAPRAEAGRVPLVVWATVAAVALAIVGLIVAAPLLIARGHMLLAGLIYNLFSYVCHQLPERSLDLDGHSLAVCSRCTGLYTGFALSVLLYPLARSLKRVDTPRLVWLLLALVPFGLDWSLGYFELWANTHLSRFLTGALLSSVAAFYIVPGLVDLGQSIRRRTLGSLARARQPSESVAATQVLPVSRSAPSDYSSPSSRI